MASAQNKPKKVSVLIFQSPRFRVILDARRKQYEATKEKDKFAVPYVLTCAAALECRLNDELVGYATKRWRGDDNPLSHSLLSMSFRGKLNSLVPILTENRYQFDRSHFVYRRLSSLIFVRNFLVHAKPISKQLAVSDKPHPLGFPILEGYYEIVEDFTLGAVEDFTPLEYHDALEKLDKWFFRRLPDKIGKVALLKRNEDA